MTLSRMSHSRYELYAGCGERYRLERVERVPKTPSIFSAAGIAFHECADWCDTNDSDFVSEGLFADALARIVAEQEEKSGVKLAAWKSVDKRPGSNQLHFDTFRNELGPEWLKMYVAWRSETQWRIADLPGGRGIEYKVEFRIGTVDEIAYVDRVFVTPYGLVVVDLKTWSKRRVTAQLPTYVVGLRKVGVNVASAGYYEARKGELSELNEYRFWDENRLAALHEQAAWMIQEGYFLPRPSDDCAVCDVAAHCVFKV